MKNIEEKKETQKNKEIEKKEIVLPKPLDLTKEPTQQATDRNLNFTNGSNEMVKRRSW